MPKLFLFAIGGTGERVLRSFTMLLASGVPTFDNYEIYPIIIDYDNKNKDKVRTVELLQNYAAIHQAAFTRHGKSSDLRTQPGQFFAAKLTNLTGLENYVFPFHPANNNEKFSDHIGYGKLSGENDTLATQQLLKSLYDESDRADTELNLDMSVGFRGNPNIGSVVFHTISSTDEFTNFTSRFQPAAGDKVTIIGSLFGGTGASGIPEIAKAINAKKADARIATILVLPYFAPAEREGGAIKASRFNSKTKAALSYYDVSGLMDKIDKVYYVGDPYPTVVPYCEGGEGQKNNANLVELIASIMIEHYVDGRDANRKEFKFSLPTSIVVRNGQRNGQRLFMYDFDNMSIERVLKHLVELAIALKLFNDEIKSGKAKDKDFYKYINLKNVIEVEGNDAQKDNDALRKLCQSLDIFYNKYHEWLKELDYEGNGDAEPANSHRFALCDMTRNYSNIILKEAKRPIEKESKLFKKQMQDLANYFLRNNHKLDANYLLTRMNCHIKDDMKGNGHYDTKTNQLREGHEPEWVLADILHLSAIDGLNQLVSY